MVELNGKRILVTFLMRLGDLALITPFIHALRKAAPDAHITFLSDEKLKDIVLNNPYLDEVITIDKKGRDNSFLAIMACAHKLSEMNFDVLINLHPNERCSLICALTKVGFRTGTAHNLFKMFWDKYIPLDRSKHLADMYLKVLTDLGVEKLEHEGLELFASEKNKNEMDQFWRDQGVFATDNLIGFNIGSAVSTKRWSTKKFAQVADYFADKGFKPVFFGGTMDEELVDEVVSYMKATPIVATGELTIGDLAEAMKRCRIIISNDSGPLHMAVSQQVPVVGIYGPSNPDISGPYTDKAIVVSAQPSCKGCKDGLKQKCKHEDYHNCMERISPQQVIVAAEELLAKYEG